MCSQSGGWCPALWMSVFSCLPSLVSQSGWWCPALWVSVSSWLPSFVSQSVWWCPALRVSVFTCLTSHGPLHLFPNGRDVALHLSPFICLPACTCFPPFVYQSGWWCLALRVCHHLSFRMSFFTCLPAYVSQRVSGSPRISFFLSLFLSVCLSAAEMLHFPTNYLMIDGCDMMMEMLTMTIGRKSEVC